MAETLDQLAADRVVLHESGIIFDDAQGLASSIEVGVQNSSGGVEHKSQLMVRNSSLQRGLHVGSLESGRLIGHGRRGGNGDAFAQCRLDIALAVDQSPQEAGHHGVAAADRALEGVRWQRGLCVQDFALREAVRPPPSRGDEHHCNLFIQLAPGLQDERLVSLFTSHQLGQLMIVRFEQPRLAARRPLATGRLRYLPRPGLHAPAGGQQFIERVHG